MGQVPAELEPNDFYLVAVSGNGGRLLVRHWFHDTLAAVKQNVRNWFDGLRIADVFNGGTPAATPRLVDLLVAISKQARGTPYERAAAVPASRSLQLLRRALHGLPLGATILAAALSRLRLDQGSARLDPARIGLIRLCVNDAVSQSSARGPIMNEALDPALDDPAYICGRLLAVFDNLQRAAQREVKVSVTIVDRYFALASTSPMVAFPKIRELAQHHLRKLRRDNTGAAVNIGRQLDELYDRLSRHGATFPRQLSLEEQGRFAIGFHHQQAEESRQAQSRKERRSNGSADVEAAPAVAS
jgi:CRISPR-associated protein Csd1